MMTKASDPPGDALDDRARALTKPLPRPAVPGRAEAGVAVVLPRELGERLVALRQHLDLLAREVRALEAYANTGRKQVGVDRLHEPLALARAQVVRIEALLRDL